MYTIDIIIDVSFTIVFEYLYREVKEYLIPEALFLTLDLLLNPQYYCERDRLLF
jgi:hypothetical protein